MNNETNSDGTPIYEVNRYDRKYLKLYCVLNVRKEKKKKLCKSIQKDKIKQNIDVTDISAKYDIFHYHCVREIKEIFTDAKGYFNVDLAVNYFIDMEYNRPEFVTSSKDILWKCFGHIIIDNINKNLKTGVSLKERPRLAYVKAVQGNEKLDKLIEQGLKRKSVVITQADLDYMNNVLKTKKNGSYHMYDKELLFALLCHYK